MKKSSDYCIVGYAENLTSIYVPCILGCLYKVHNSQPK